MKVMVVDDEAFSTMLIENHLKEMGCDVCSSAATGEEAISNAIHEKPDLIFMDICLNGPIDGIEAAKQILSQIKSSIVFMSGYSYQEYTNRIEDIKPLTSLTKPIDSSHIQSVVNLFNERI